MSAQEKWTKGLIFEPHGGFGSTDPDGEPWPFGYISTSTPSPVFELSTVLKFPRADLEDLARKMAAAPDLVEACEGLIRLYEADEGAEDIPEIIAARAAVAKARGSQ